MGRSGIRYLYDVLVYYPMRFPSRIQGGVVEQATNATNTKKVLIKYLVRHIIYSLKLTVFYYPTLSRDI